MHKKACCFTGHRPDKLPYQGNESSAAVIRLKTRLEKEIRRQIGVGTRVFITGMAMGVDIWCAEIVAMLKKEFSYEHIELIAAVPYPGQSYKWPKDWYHPLVYFFSFILSLIILCFDFNLHKFQVHFDISRVLNVCLI